jgi:hypothetical protein
MLHGETAMNLTSTLGLDRLIAENCLKLFADYDLEIRSGEVEAVRADERFLLCGIIGFTSKFVRGALVLATTEQPLERTNPTSTPSHRDWICELANQLLGRVKNQMLTRGVEIFPSTPVALCGEHLSPVVQQRLIAELFTAEGGVVCVWLDCEFDDGFALGEAELRACSIPPLSEGEIILF